MFRMIDVKRMILAAGALITLLSSPVLAADVQQPDWTVTLQTEVQTGVLNYSGSGVSDPVKVTVSYVDNKGQTKPASGRYECLWYSGQGKPIGQEKFLSYPMKAQDQIELDVQHKSSPATQKEFQACADAALRFYLDASIHQGYLPAISVPLTSFDGIEKCLEGMNFSQYSPALESHGTDPNTLVIYLVSNPTGKQQYLQYNQ